MVLASDFDNSFLDEGDSAWILTSTALVMFMIPGLGYFYAGLAQHKNALSLIFFSMISLAVVSIQWLICGFSLAFSTSGNGFIGNLKHGFFIGIFDHPLGVFVHEDAPTIPGGVYAIYQGMFAAITPALAFGAVAERARLGPAIIFIFLWTTLVYDFLAYWTWGVDGWMRVLGSLDFAGGTPVHIASGAAGLAYAIVAGKREGYGKISFKPHSLSTVFMGTAFLWFGWFGFNGGAGLASNARAGLAMVNTNLSASVGALTWVMRDYVKTGKFSAFGFCSGVVAGLVCITPAAGFVQPYYAPFFGLFGALSCYAACDLKIKMGFDDALDAFGVHGVGGIVGNLLVGIFASQSAAGTGGATIKGGWVDGNFVQLPIQLATTLAGFSWSFLVTLIMLLVMNRVLPNGLRLTDLAEMEGTDKSQLGDTANDYMESMLISQITGSMPGGMQQLDRSRPRVQSDASTPIANA